jgi:hypothetical protein
MDPGTFIEMMTPRDLVHALALSISSHAESTNEAANIASARDPVKGAMFLHPNGARRLTAMRVTAPRADVLPPAAAYLEREGLMTFAVGAGWLLEVTLDNAAQRIAKDFRPTLPLIIRY